MWKKVKELKDFVLLVLGGIALAFIGAKAHQRKKAADRMQHKAEVLLNSDIKEHIEEGEKLLVKAANEKVKATNARMDAEDQLRKLGEKNETLDDIAHRFNSRRVRKQPGADS